MKQIILKHIDIDGMTEYFQFEGNVMISVGITAFNVFITFYESFGDVMSQERIEVPVDFDIDSEDYNTLLNYDDAEEILGLLAQRKIEGYFEKYLVSDDIAFDISSIVNKRIIPVLEEEAHQLATKIRKKEEINKGVEKITKEIDEYIDKNISDPDCDPD